MWLGHFLLQKEDFECNQQLGYLRFLFKWSLAKHGHLTRDCKLSSIRIDEDDFQNCFVYEEEHEWIGWFSRSRVWENYLEIPQSLLENFLDSVELEETELDMEEGKGKNTVDAISKDSKGEEDLDAAEEKFIKEKEHMKT